MSQFNTESRYRSRDSDLKYILLVPANYTVDDFYLNDSDVVTLDSEYFWQAPQKIKN